VEEEVLSPNPLLAPLLTPSSSRWVRCRRAGRNSHCSVPPPPPTHGIGRRGVGDKSRISFVLSCLSLWTRLLSLGAGLGGGQRGSLQRAATARTADRKTGQNVRRHDLYRSNASMIKQKKNHDDTPHADLGRARSLCCWRFPRWRLLSPRQMRFRTAPKVPVRSDIYFPVMMARW